MLRVIKGVYENQSIRLLESPPEGIQERSEVLIIFDVHPTVQQEKDVQKRSLGETFSGRWVDDRPAEEIIADIRKHRTGFGNRDVPL